MIQSAWIFMLLSIPGPLAAQVYHSFGVIAGQAQEKADPYSEWKDLLALSKPFPLGDDYNRETSRTEGLIVRACHDAGIEDIYQRAVKASTSPDPMYSPEEPKTFDAILDQVIKIVRKSNPKAKEYPALLYCFDSIALRRLKFADNILDGWGQGGQYPKSPWAERQKQLSESGLVYFVDRTQGLHLDRKVLRSLAANHQGTFWGQEALLEETQSACNPDVANEEDYFKIIIARLSPFISKYHDSPFASALTIELARAYETWWNLANNSRGEFQDAHKYEIGGEKAREKAVQLYRQYLTIQSDEEVLKRVEQLEQKEITGHTCFFCLDD